MVVKELYISEFSKFNWMD